MYFTSNFNTGTKNIKIVVMKEVNGDSFNFVHLPEDPLPGIESSKMKEIYKLSGDQIAWLTSRFPLHMEKLSENTVTKAEEETEVVDTGVVRNDVVEKPTYARPAVGFPRKILEDEISERKVIEINLNESFDHVIEEDVKDANVLSAIFKVIYKENEIYLIPPRALSLLLYMARSDLKVLSREVCEKDHDHVHLIGYSILSTTHVNPYGIFRYVRAGKSASDLMAKHSIGVGGHLEDLDDYNDPSDIWKIVNRYITNEVEEEVGISLEKKDLPKYLDNWGIYDSSNEIGRHHFGIMNFLDLFDKETGVIEAQLGEPGVIKHSDFADNFESLVKSSNWEPWSVAAMVTMKYIDADWRKKFSY